MANNKKNSTNVDFIWFLKTSWNGLTSEIVFLLLTLTFKTGSCGRADKPIDFSMSENQNKTKLLAIANWWQVESGDETYLF